VPFPIGQVQLEDPAWIPMNDALNEVYGDIRRLSAFRAYHCDVGEEQPDPAEMHADSRLIGRSVWNTRWLLVIPGGYLLSDADAGLDQFVDTVSDIKLFFQTYAYSGNKKLGELPGEEVAP